MLARLMNIGIYSGTRLEPVRRTFQPHVGKRTSRPTVQCTGIDTNIVLTVVTPGDIVGKML